MDLDNEELKATRKLNGTDKTIDSRKEDITDWLIEREEAIGNDKCK